MDFIIVFYKQMTIFLELKAVIDDTIKQIVFKIKQNWELSNHMKHPNAKKGYSFF